MDTTLAFDADLLRRYDRPGPRYTSYPTAPQFHEARLLSGRRRRIVGARAIVARLLHFPDGGSAPLAAR